MSAVHKHELAVHGTQASFFLFSNKFINIILKVLYFTYSTDTRVKLVMKSNNLKLSF